MIKYLALKDIFQKCYIKIFFIFLFVVLLAKGYFLVYSDFNISYPFLFPDSYDWIANGLYYEGYSVNYSMRSPGLPILIALFDKMAVLNLLPMINQLVLFGIYLTAYKILRINFSKVVSTIVVLILFFNFFLQNLSLYILADLYATLFISLGVLYYLKARKRESNYIFSAVFLAISFLFQYALPPIALAILIHFLLFKRKLSKKTFLLAFFSAFLIIFSWLLYKKIVFDSFFYSGVQQIELLKLHFDSIFFYFINIVSVLGVLPFIIFVVGLLKFFFKNKNIQVKTERESLYLYILIFFSWFTFWVLLYNWNDRRFIVYLIFFVAPFIAVGLQYVFSLLHKTTLIKKSLVCLFFLLTIISSSTQYPSCLSADELKLSNGFGIKIQSTTDANFNSQLIFKNFHISNFEGEYNFFPINFINLSKIRKENKVENIKKLEVISGKIYALKTVCVKYEDLNGANWYIDKNKYGNYFKTTLQLFPKCNNPLVDLNRLELIH